jgi:hypothetical protein
VSNTPQPVPPATEQPKIDDGGQAFPHCYFIDITGMSLRDYFAAAAMQGMLASGGTYDSWAALVRDAYAVADAMLAARKSGGAA